MLTPKGVGLPPDVIPAVAVPYEELPPVSLAVFKSLTSVQPVPFHSSTAVLGPLFPPSISPAVAVPHPMCVFFATFKAPTSVQLEPS